MILTDAQKIIFGGILAFVVAILLFVWNARNQKEEERLQAAAKAEIRKKSAAEFQAKESQRLLEEAAQRELAEQRRIDEKRDELQRVLDKSLFDPYAIRLKNVRLVQGNGGYALCGEINAKTASGKYSGERSFAVTEISLDKAGGQVIGISRTGDLQEPSTVAALLISAGCQ